MLSKAKVPSRKRILSLIQEYWKRKAVWKVLTVQAEDRIMLYKRIQKNTRIWFSLFSFKVFDYEEKRMYQVLQEVLDSDFSLKVDWIQQTWSKKPGRKLSYDTPDNFYMQSDYEEKFRRIMVDKKIIIKKVRNSILFQLKNAQANYKEDEEEKFILSRKVSNVYKEDAKYLCNFFKLMYLTLIAQQMMEREIPFPERNNLIEIEVDTPVLIEKVTDHVEIPNSVGDTSICSEKVKNCNLFLSSKTI
jgi:hypothetical protein